jgi:hypothetical protein
MQSVYEIYEVPGDRWANMITFGVRVKDEFRDMDFENFNFGLSWDTTEFSYVPGTFEAGLATTQSMEFVFHPSPFLIVQPKENPCCYT